MKAGKQRSDSGHAEDAAPVVAPSLAAPAGTPLYVHVPYCVALCSYCDFYSVVANEAGEAADTVTTILREASHRAPKAPRSVFIGGGTPSMLEEADLVRLLDGLDERTGFRASAREVTVECNPESLTYAKARAMREGGVDRLSIGVQSLDPAILALFGRVHSVDDSLRAFHDARKAGFERLSVDLIYAVPGQDLAAWESDLDRIITLGPDHISAYSLAFEEGTMLTRALELGDLERLPEEVELAFFLRTRERLAASGYAPYEVSNFASSTQRCTHNEQYWRNEPYVGVGPGAVSKLAHTRFGNPRSVPLWRAGIDAGGFGASWEETPDPIERLGETWWLGLRTLDGVDPERARATAFAGEADGMVPSVGDDPALAEARRLAEQGFLEPQGQRWRLTSRGLPVADAVSRRFLALSTAFGSSGNTAGNAT